MPLERIVIGQLVKSQAGRDFGSHYVVVDFSGPSFVLLADGRTRRVNKPKKKNIRHVSVLKIFDKGIAAKNAGGRAVTDEDIRAAIKACGCTGDYGYADEEGEPCPNRTLSKSKVP